MKYYGLCVGGIWDGKYAAHDNNILRIPNPEGRVILLPDGSRAGYQPHLFHTYVFCTRYWWPYGEGRPIPGLTTILDQLDSSYHSTRMAAESEVHHGD